MNKKLNMVRVVAAYPRVHVGNPHENLKEIVKTLTQLKDQEADVILLPELAVTGYTCGDLFNQTTLLEEALAVVQELTSWTYGKLLVVGFPFAVGHTLYNCAAVLGNNSILGIVPKSYLPNYKEFYESRWFYPAPKTTGVTVPNLGRQGPVPFGTDILFECIDYPDLKIGVEICEDVWAPIPPSSYQAIAGATLLLNLSASNETVAKSEYRRRIVEQQSGRCVAAYAYCSSGPTESTTDLVFGGHCIIAENGSIIAETKRFQVEDSIVVDVDIEKLVNERRRTPTFSDSQQCLTTGWLPPFRTIEFGLNQIKDATNIQRNINPLPFVPADPDTLNARCEEIFNIQVCALAKRMEQVPNKKFVIGVSGGLDSTLALLVAVKAAQRVGLSPKCIDAVTMPGFGTSDRTRNNALSLMTTLGVKQTVINIGSLCLEAFKEIDHQPFGIDLGKSENHDNYSMTLKEFRKALQAVPPGSKDVVFENVQARIRTFLLMSRGFVLGTGDMSELALGWCTYNGDHMSMYNVNCSIPKTLVKFLVAWVADNPNTFNDPSKAYDGDKNANIHCLLHDIVKTVVSPELLPLGKDGEIVHSTEEVVGPYELHDFFLLNFVRNNFGVKKISLLAKHAFCGQGITSDRYTQEEIDKWLKVFIRRFFSQQFKRSCVADGPKVGSVSLSPRGDWRMPSDADPDMWIKELEEQ